MKKRNKFILAACALPPAAAADVYKYVFARRRPPLLVAMLDKKTHGEDYYAWRDKNAEAMRNRMHLCYTLTSDRGEQLQGNYFPCGAKFSKKIAFIVHGYHSEHAETAGMLRKFYHSRGFDIFAPDNTASGLSGGDYFGYDTFESADCLKWLEFLKNEFGHDIQVIMHGFSLGAAAVMKMIDRVPDCVRFTVADSGFTDARDILKPQLGVFYSVIARMNKTLAGYELADTDVTKNLANARTPLLIVHGMDDPTVPFFFAPRAAEACSSYKETLFTEGTAHIETMFLYPEEYGEKLDKFIGKFIKQDIEK